MSKSAPLQCPSAPCRAGANLLGVVQGDGTIAHLPEAMPVTANFVEVSGAGRPAAKRFRFSNTCAKSGCGQWAENRCGVVDKAIHHLVDAVPSQPLPRCSIRSACRWFSQRGADACKVCRYVVTDLTVA